MRRTLCLLMRCGFGGFSGSICWPLLPTCRQLVTACQSSATQRALITSDMAEQVKREREEGSVLGDERCEPSLVSSAFLPGHPLLTLI